MKWLKYKSEFTAHASSKGFDDLYVERCLNYAQKLYDNNLPIIYDQFHFASMVGYDYQYILRASNGPELFYRVFKINKKNGEDRTISEPLPSLKEIQRWILDNVLYRCAVSKFAKAFVPKKNIKENARFHKNQKHVLSIDIKNFFPSIKFPKVYSLFKYLGYSKSVAVLLAKLCTLNRSLPQGAPTSPALSNLILYRVDKRLSAFALKNKIRYTRYADDITFSGDLNTSNVLKISSKVLEEEKLVLNHSKTRLMMKHQKQEVTGIVVNTKLQAPNELRRKLRQEIYYINKYGLDSHIIASGNNRANYVAHLKGVAQFILFVNGKDLECIEHLKFLNEFS